VNIGRVGTLLKKEFREGYKNYFFLFAVFAPLLVTLIMSISFGSVFSSKPVLGIYSDGTPDLVRHISGLESIGVKLFSTQKKLQQAVGSGEADMGISFPSDFRRDLKQGRKLKIKTYIWGESLLKDRAVLGAAIISSIREITGRRLPANIKVEAMGGVDKVPWKDRLLPMIVLMAIFMGGFLIPSSSLVNEKQKGTMPALLVTPVTRGDLLWAKGLLGFFMSLFMGIFILVLNRAYGANFPLLLLLLTLGAVMAAVTGVLFGILMKTITSLYSMIESLGLLLYGPGLIYMFPKIPEWIGKLLPTYYILNPVMEVTRKGAGWGDISVNVFILIGIILVLIALTAVTAARRFE